MLSSVYVVRLCKQETQSRSIAAEEATDVVVVSKYLHVRVRTTNAQEKKSCSLAKAEEV